MIKSSYSPTVSIITPTRNRAALLEKHFISLEDQLTPYDEIIIIDNNSTDNTKEILQIYKKKFQMKILFAPDGTNYGALYNKGIKAAAKDILVFLDDDCIADSYYIEKIRIAHKKNTHVLIQGMTKSLPKNNIYAEIMGDHYQIWIQSNLLSDGIHMRTFDNKNASIKRTLLTKELLFNESLTHGSEDIELGYRLVKNGICIQLDREILAYHVERDSLQSFLKQHYRIAKSEKRIYEDNKRVIGLVNRRTRYYIGTAHHRFTQLLSQRRYKDAVIFPFIYILLILIRSTAYINQESS